jgi:hypothetical protein
MLLSISSLQGTQDGQTVSWSKERVYQCLVALRAWLETSEEKEQGVRTKFCVKLGENGTETFEMLKILLLLTSA